MNDYEIYQEVRRRKIRKAFAELLHNLYMTEEGHTPLPLPSMDDEEVKKYIRNTLGLV